VYKLLNQNNFHGNPPMHAVASINLKAFLSQQGFKCINFQIENNFIQNPNAFIQ